MKLNMTMNVTDNQLKNSRRKDEVDKSHIHLLSETKLNGHSVIIISLKVIDTLTLYRTNRDRS